MASSRALSLCPSGPGEPMVVIHVESYHYCVCMTKIRYSHVSQASLAGVGLAGLLRRALALCGGSSRKGVWLHIMLTQGESHDSRHDVIILL